MGKTLKLKLNEGPTELGVEYGKLPEPDLSKNYVHKCSFPNCDKSFPKPSKLRTHETTHSKEKPFKCSFEGCLSSYYRNNHLKRHEATRHVKLGGDYMCEFDGCFASFETSLSLYYHCKRNHYEKKYNCSTCQQMFSKKYLLKEHEYSHTAHKEEKPFRCSKPNCKEEFTTHTNLRAHQKQHKKDESLQQSDVRGHRHASPSSHECKECEISFEKWSQYVSHRKIAHPKVQCPICKEVFTKSSLRGHLKIHEENRSAYYCTYGGCSKFYYRSNNLSQHIRHAHEGRSFQCSACRRKLSTKQKLALHMQVVHANNKSDESKVNRTNLLKMLCGQEEKCFQAPKRSGPARGHKLKQAKFDTKHYGEPSAASADTLKSLSSCSDSVQLEKDSNMEISELPSEVTV